MLKREMPRLLGPKEFQHTDRQSYLDNMSADPTRGRYASPCGPVTTP